MFCRAPGLIEDESSIELTPPCSLLEHDELDLDEAYDQLERMKQRVLQMKSMIVPPAATTADPVQAEFEKLADSDNIQLREVQQETSRSFQQIELVRNRLAETSKDMANLAARIEESERCTKDLAKKLDKVPKWIEDIKHHVGLCIERHNELDITCCSYLTYSNHMRPLLVTLEHHASSKISMPCYRKQYTQIFKLVKRTRLLLNQTHAKLVAYTQFLKNSLMQSTPKPLPNLLRISCLIRMLDQNHHVEKPKKATFKVRTRTRASIRLATAASKIKFLEPTSLEDKTRTMPEVIEE